MVHVNASARSSGTVNDFSIDFQTRDLDNVTKVTMIKATLPRMFPNIWSVNNTIVIQHAGSNTSYSVPAGQYTALTLLAALNTATAGAFVTWTYDTTLQRYIATYSSVTTVTLMSTLSSIATYIGLSADVLLGAPAAMPSPPQLSGPDEVFIQSGLVATSSCVESGATQSIPLLGSISFVDVPYGFTGRFDARHPEISHIDIPYAACMRKIDVRLCDNLGNTLACPDNCFLDMILQFTH